MDNFLNSQMWKLRAIYRMIGFTVIGSAVEEEMYRVKNDELEHLLLVAVQIRAYLHGCKRTISHIKMGRIEDNTSSTEYYKTTILHASTEEVVKALESYMEKCHANKSDLTVADM